MSPSCVNRSTRRASAAPFTYRLHPLESSSLAPTSRRAPASAALLVRVGHRDVVPRQDVTVRAHVNAVQVIDGRAGDEEAHRRVVDVDAASGSSASAWCAVLLQGAGADQGHGCVQQLECLPQARERLPKLLCARLLVSYSR